MITRVRRRSRSDEDIRMAAETVDQYITRILSFSDGKDPLVVLRGTGPRLRELRATTEPERWRTQHAPGQWSAGQVLAHLADAEVVAAWRVRSILAQDGVPLQAFDQNVWAEAFKYAEVDPDESLASFTAVRTSLLSLLGRVDAFRLEHHGMHAERGRETIAHLLRLYAGHDLNHLAQIEQRLRS
jgi:DinB superfamily